MYFSQQTKKLISKEEHAAHYVVIPGAICPKIYVSVTE